jgi:sulfide:quinone oxidoreductase
VELDDATTLDYDFSIVCAGGRRRPALEGAITFPGTEPLRIGELLAPERDNARMAFVVPPGVVWALPIYELALMTQRYARTHHRHEVEVTIYTPEESPLALFGPAASATVGELLAGRGIAVETDTFVHEDAAGGLTTTPGDRPLSADVVVAVPAMDGPAIPGLPADEGGFIPIDEHARVRGVDGVYAAGDGTDFPIKQGGLATQQADAAASHLAHRLGAAVPVEPFHPVLRGKLLTGDESLHLRADVAGGGGEGEANLDSLWWPSQKISGRYLASWLARGAAHLEPMPPQNSLEVEVALPQGWQREPMAFE